MLAGAFRDGNLFDQRVAIVLNAVIAALMSAAWLPAFPYLNRHRELMKPNVADDFFAPQVKRPAIGIVLYVVGAAMGWFLQPLIGVAVFILIIVYYAWTSQGIDSRPLHNGLIAVQFEDKDRSASSGSGWQGQRHHE